MKATVSDEFFGSLTWNPLCDYWEGEANFSGGVILVCVGTPDGKRDQTVTPEARNAFSRVLAHQSAFIQKAADDLLLIHNENWHHYENTPPLTSRQFQARLELECIEVKSWGAAVAYYNDGDLFWGHAIRVEQEEDGNFHSKAISEG